MTDENARLWPVADLRAFLAGGWRIARTLNDRRIGLDGTLDGTARFVPATDGGLRYTETGTLCFGEHMGTAEQIYFYDFAEPGRADIRRHDGMPFHPLDLTGGRAVVTHHCGDDVYTGRYSVLDRNQWLVEWQVAGPRKDQCIVTRYVRMA